MFFDSWYALFRVLVVGSLAYITLVAMLRVSGNRTLSKMNAFDLVVTVALGSTLATTLLSKSVALLEGVLALAMLITLQWLITWVSVRSARWERLVKSEPVLIAFKGELLESTMRRERVTEAAVNAALRAQGQPSLTAVKAVVLETDGTVTVIPQQSAQSLSALQNVRGYPPQG